MNKAFSRRLNQITPLQSDAFSEYLPELSSLVMSSHFFSSTPISGSRLESFGPKKKERKKNIACKNRGKTCGWLTIGPVAGFVEDALLVLLDDEGFEAGVIDKGTATRRIPVLKDKGTALRTFVGGSRKLRAPTAKLNEITFVGGQKNWRVQEKNRLNPEFRKLAAYM